MAHSLAGGVLEPVDEEDAVFEQRGLGHGGRDDGHALGVQEQDLHLRGGRACRCVAIGGDLGEVAGYGGGDVHGGEGEGEST